MNTIWVVEQGDYSDYRVVGVFSSEANAKLVCDKINSGEPYEIATMREWPIDPSVDELNQGLDRYFVSMRQDGHVEHAYKDKFDVNELTNDLKIWERSKTKNFEHRAKEFPDLLQGRVMAADEQHAVKIVNEKRAQMIAMNEWPNG